MAERAYDVAQPNGVVAARFAQALRELDQTHGWQLDAAAFARYCDALAALHPDGCVEPLLSRIVVAYHLDHALVCALAEPHHPDHQRAWLNWMPQVVAVLRSNGFAAYDDGASDLDDLAQIARLELAKSLHLYRYRSRFSTWAYQVIIRSAWNELRTRGASKRVAQTLSLEAAVAAELAIAESDHPESVAAARLLAALAATVLGDHADARLSKIFELWAVEDRRVVEIGAQVGLSQARVRALLSQIVELLRNDVRIRDWLSDKVLSETEP